MQLPGDALRAGRGRRVRVRSPQRLAPRRAERRAAACTLPRVSGMALMAYAQCPGHTSASMEPGDLFARPPRDAARRADASQASASGAAAARGSGGRRFRATVAARRGGGESTGRGSQAARRPGNRQAACGRLGARLVGGAAAARGNDPGEKGGSPCKPNGRCGRRRGGGHRAAATSPATAHRGRQHDAAPGKLPVPGEFNCTPWLFPRVTAQPLTAEMFTIGNHLRVNLWVYSFPVRPVDKLPDVDVGQTGPACLSGAFATAACKMQCPEDKREVPFFFILVLHTP
eukprot:366045-Chlamydomonas_euryale.AAC.8